MRPQQPVNRVLFRDENSGGENEELEIWKKSRSDSADSDDGLTFASDVNSGSPLGKTLQPVQESPVARMNMLVRFDSLNVLTMQQMVAEVVSTVHNQSCLKLVELDLMLPSLMASEVSF